MRRTGMLMAVALVATLAVTSACGDAGSDDETEPTVSRNDYLAAGNDICRREFDKITARIEWVSDPEEFKGRAIQIALGAIWDLEALPRPRGDGAELGDIYLEAQEVLRKALEEARTWEDLNRAFAEVDEALSGYGLVECAP